MRDGEELLVAIEHVAESVGERELGASWRDKMQSHIHWLQANTATHATENMVATTKSGDLSQPEFRANAVPQLTNRIVLAVTVLVSNNTHLLDGANIWQVHLYEFALALRVVHNVRRHLPFSACDHIAECLGAYCDW